MVKGLIAGVLGLMIATVGTDPVSGVGRFTFDRPELLDGIPFILVMVGVFAMSELFTQAGTSDWSRSDASGARDTRLKLPSLRTLYRLRRSQLIGCVAGTLEGLMPGGGASVAAFIAYNEARRWSNEPEKFGKGAEEGVVAPETANNVVACTALIPTLSIGIPGSNSTAILLGGLLLHGLRPGPLLFDHHPDVVYGLFAGLAVANVAMLLIGIVILTPTIWLVNRPKPYLLAMIYALVFSGVYSIDHSVFDLGIVLAAGVAGYVMRTLGFPYLPLVLGLVLGYMVEANYRRSLLMTNGDHIVFLQDPVSVLFLSLAVVFLVVSALREARSRRKALGEGSAGASGR